MADDPNKTDYNTAVFTKLSQLQKVVEYLNFHLEEHIFQVAELQKRYEREEDRIINDAQVSIESIYASLKVRSTGAIKQINEDFVKKTNELKSEMREISTKLSGETNSSLKNVFADLEYYKSLLRRISREMRKEINFFKDDSKIDPMDVQKKLNLMIKRHNDNLKTHDEESQRKQNLLEEQSEIAMKEVDAKYKGIIADYHRKLRPPPAVRNKIVFSLKEMKAEIFELRNVINKMRSNAKKLSSTNFTHNSLKSKEIADEIALENKEFVGKLEKAKNILQDSIYELKANLNIAVENRNEQNRLHEIEIDKLNEELRDTNPVQLFQKKITMEEDKIEKKLQQIEKQIIEIKDLNALHEKEKSELKEKFEVDKNHENEEFLQKRIELEKQIQLQNLYYEKIREKESLQNFKQKLSSQPKTIKMDLSMKVDSSEIKALFKKEYVKAQIEKKTSISTIFNELDQEFEQFKDGKKDEYEAQMALITKEYNDNNIVEKVSHQYEELLLSLERQFEEIEVPDKNAIESVADLKSKQLEVQNNIKESRQELITNFEDQIREEDKRFRNSPFFADDKDFKSVLLEEQTKNRQRITYLNEKISCLETNLEKLNVSNNINNSQIEDNSLKTMKDDCKFKIKRALQQSVDASKDIIGQISETQSYYAKLIFDEKSENTKEPIEKQGQIERLTQELQLKKEINERNYESAKQTYERKQKFIKNSYNKDIRHLKTQIRTLKSLMDEDEKHHNIEFERNQISFNKLIAQHESEFFNSIPSKLSDNSLEFNNKISQLQRERDAKKRMFENKNGMREKERIEIDKLEIELCDKSKELATLGKELVIAREQSMRKVSEPKPIMNPMSLSGKVVSKRAATSVEIKRPPNLSHSTGKMLNFK
ncbi:hypothetical protein TRFO_30864 [Tritrichomonas foetus]|uniref:Uncharacterized protein n=1 Tax=Tritrichomonas foetus TaxID=1144522 RepID=A0A1J4JY05_9EUKA|nr:hypothetical protein TRFO_30864 [Tritrichomonas foetus]|eukprot:OHT02157.1 hypothetical protein TRFO_30864 [Tritrichomonas foetus]